MYVVPIIAIVCIVCIVCIAIAIITIGSCSQEKFINLLPNAKAITLPSQGNFIPHDAPELWVQEIENFLK